MDSKLFVGNLTFSVTYKDLLEMFSPLGLVVNVKIVTDREAGRPRGFAFVTMNTK
jgi:cold-inducible RNA-binding protein